MTDEVVLSDIEFGDWGKLPLEKAMEVLIATLDHFDQEGVIEAEQKHQAMITAAKRYYDGNHVKPLKIEPGEPDDNVIVNFSRTMVDDGVSWLFGDPETGQITFETEGQDMTGEEGNWFDELWESSGGLKLLKRLGKRGGISGHNFVKLVDPDEGELYPQIVGLDPTMVAVRTDPKDSDRAVAYRLEWLTREIVPYTANRREEYVNRQLTVNAGTAKEPFWLIAEFKSPNRRKKKWEITSGPYGWPYPWSPIHDAPNIDPAWGYYGLSDLEDAAWLNDNVNFLASNTMRILKIHAHPRTVGTGFTANDIQDTSIDAFWSIPAENAKVYNLEMQSDLQSSLAMLDFVRGAFWTIGRGLDVSVYKDKIGQITNFALRVLAIRALNKMGDKRISYGKLIRDINDHAQEMMGIEKPEPTVINWPVPLPISDKEELESLSTEVSLEIVSKQTAAEERGRSWEKERGRIAAEKEENVSFGEYLLRNFDRGGVDVE